MNPDQIPKGAGQLETPGDGRPVNEPGVYKHPGSGAQLIVMPDARSTAQQDALVRMGFVKVAEAPTRVELDAMQKAQVASDKALADKGVMPGITADPNSPRFNPTASINVEDAPKLVAEAEARAQAAEAELAALKAAQATPAETESTGEDASEGSEESTPPATDQTNSNEGN
jgi:hypothetical protein